ncbi:ogr/Delta-like zinc finger family protein [Pseudomonas sp. S2_E02]
MRVSCKSCGEKGRIVSREELSLEFARLYCQCGSVACRHTWIANLMFSHTLSLSAKAIDRLLFDRLRSLSREKQRDLFEQLNSVVLGAAAVAFAVSRVLIRQ